MYNIIRGVMFESLISLKIKIRTSYFVWCNIFYIFKKKLIITKLIIVCFCFYLTRISSTIQVLCVIIVLKQKKYLNKNFRPLFRFSPPHKPAESIRIHKFFLINMTIISSKTSNSLPPFFSSTHRRNILRP